MGASVTHRTIEAIWRIESAKLIAVIARMVGDLGIAEDLAHDALIAALERWPEAGVPEKPAAWLMATAKHMALNHLHRGQLLERKLEQLANDLETEPPKAEPDLDDDFGDDMLRLVFTACHPSLSQEARVALTLRLVGGLTTAEIAQAYLVPESTVAQRIVRAKKAIAKSGVAFEVPAGAERAERLASVLEVIYLVFNEGYAASGGETWMRPELCEEALRLGRILAELMPQEGEVHGLVALLEIQASRMAARVGPSGEPILLLDQNRARWDHLLIQRGLAALARAEATGSPWGSYTLQAAIAACHARARTAEETDWARIAAIYSLLEEATPSPVVTLNRAVAISMAYGPAAGLAIVETLAEEPSLAEYHLLASVRGDLLFKLARFAEAQAAFERAASLAGNGPERALMEARAQACASAASASRN